MVHAQAAAPGVGLSPGPTECMVAAAAASGSTAPRGGCTSAVSTRQACNSQQKTGVQQEQLQACSRQRCAAASGVQQPAFGWDTAGAMHCAASSCFAATVPGAINALPCG